MAGKRNRLFYESGKALSEPLREEIIEIYNEGFSVTVISNDARVTVCGVNKFNPTVRSAFSLFFS